MPSIGNSSMIPNHTGHFKKKQQFLKKRVKVVLISFIGANLSHSFSQKHASYKTTYPSFFPKKQLGPRSSSTTVGLQLFSSVDFSWQQCYLTWWTEVSEYDVLSNTHAAPTQRQNGNMYNCFASGDV